MASPQPPSISNRAMGVQTGVSGAGARKPALERALAEALADPQRLARFAALLAAIVVVLALCGAFWWRVAEAAVTLVAR